MRTPGLRFLSLGLLVLASEGVGACAKTADDCQLIDTCASTSSGGGGGAGGNATTSTGTEGGGGTAGGGGGSGGGGPGPGCDPTMKTKIASSCGVFVSSSKGDDTNAGSESAPFKTIAHALEHANGKPVYVCGEAFSEAAVVSRKTSVFGALDCKKGWIYDKTKPTTLTADADVIPLSIAAGASGSAISDFTITAADSAKDGGSSIGVLANADVTLERLTIKTGRGHDGQAGASQQALARSAAGVTGVNGLCTSTNPELGGAGGAQMCDGDDVSGGRGGLADVTGPGGTGANGSPTGVGTFPDDGVGGLGQPNAATSCKPGDAGADGSPGNSGHGAHGGGQIKASGYAPPSASAGASKGTHGQGAGGGGAAASCAGKANASGGGGGGGGCGGAAGNAGHSGGSSIGIAARGAKLSLTDVTITTDRGGDGGLGGDGQIGGNGGAPGPQGDPLVGNSCVGGNGGRGGRGGSGGGGAGGHSAGIALDGSSIVAMANLQVLPSTKGNGAIGGDSDMTQGAIGDDGQSCSTLDLKSATCN